MLSEEEEDLQSQNILSPLPPLNPLSYSQTGMIHGTHPHLYPISRCEAFWTVLPYAEIVRGRIWRRRRIDGQRWCEVCWKACPRSEKLRWGWIYWLGAADDPWCRPSRAKRSVFLGETILQQSGGHGVADSLLVNRKHYVMFGKFNGLMQSRVRSFVVTISEASFGSRTQRWRCFALSPWSVLTPGGPRACSWRVRRVLLAGLYYCNLLPLRYRTEPLAVSRRLCLINPRHEWSILSGGWVFKFSNFAKPAFHWFKKCYMQ